MSLLNVFSVIKNLYIHCDTANSTCYDDENATWWDSAASFSRLERLNLKSEYSKQALSQSKDKKAKSPEAFHPRLFYLVLPFLLAVTKQPLPLNSRRHFHT